MKCIKLFFATVVVTLATLSVSNASQLVDNLKAGKDQTVVVYGTSLTANANAGWVGSLKTWLNGLSPSSTATIINSGQSGKASRTGLDKLQAAVIDKKPDTVFIEFSMNDAYRGPSYAPGNIDYEISLQESKNNLKLMISRILTALPSTEIIIQTMNCIYDGPSGTGSATARQYLADYYQGYRDVYEELKNNGVNVILVDNEPNWIALRDSNYSLFKAYLDNNGLHPTDAGSKAITFPAIQAALTTPIPEPATNVALAGLALGGIIVLRLRRK